MFTIKNVSATTPRVFHLSFDKQGQPDIAQVAKQSISLPTGFPKGKFLELFEEWKLAHNNSDLTNGGNDRNKYFAQLRDMHQQYGINAGSILWADEEMLAFGEYVRKAQIITDNTRGAIIAPPRSWGPIIVPPLSGWESYIGDEGGKLLGEFAEEFWSAKIIVNNKEYVVKQLTRATKEVRMHAKADIYVIELDKPHNTDTNSDKLYFKKESGKWVPALATANSYSVATTWWPADTVVKFTSKNNQP
jgi:hypothetical protein